MTARSHPVNASSAFFVIRAGVPLSVSVFPSLWVYVKAMPLFCEQPFSMSAASDPTGVYTVTLYAFLLSENNVAAACAAFPPPQIVIDRTAILQKKKLCFFPPPSSQLFFFFDDLSTEGEVV